MANMYHYLVAGFPNLSFEQGGRAVDHLQLKEQVSAQLCREDVPLWEAMYLPYDNYSLLNLLLERKTPLSPLGKFTQEELEEAAQQSANLPPYMLDFISFYSAARDAKSEADLTPIALEAKLHALFYAYIETLNSAFVRRWYAFDRGIRNVQATLLNRKLGKEMGYGLVGSDSITETLSKSMSADFGLKGEVDGLDTALQLFESRDIIGREWKLDELRWQMAEEYTAFDFFTLDKVLSFAVKLQLIDRWAAMGKDLGQQRLQEMMSSSVEVGSNKLKVEDI